MSHIQYLYAGLHESLQPCSRAARKWRENEEMKRKWRENEEMERKWGNGERDSLSRFPHCVLNCFFFVFYKNKLFITENDMICAFVLNPSTSSRWWILARTKPLLFCPHRDAAASVKSFTALEEGGGIFDL